MKLTFDFTLGMYDKLCQAIIRYGFKTLTVAQALERMSDIGIEDRYIILRHDVDRYLRFATAMSEIESAYGISASYYFRIPRTFRPDCIQRILHGGHEIGLHYECLDKARGDIEKASRIIADELEMLRAISPIRTISMHGNPMTRFDNRDIWRYCKFDDFNLVGEVYLSMDFEKFMYFSDTGRTWQDGKYNLKDVVPQGQKCLMDKPKITTTKDLIDLLSCEKRNIYLLIHPERWSSASYDWAFSIMKDTSINAIKWGIMKSKGIRG